MRDLLICDIDGTISDATHREHHARARNWELFHQHAIEDEPVEAVRCILAAWEAHGHQVVFCTGRPERYRQATEWWLGEHLRTSGGAPIGDALLMRPNDDKRSDIEVKPAILFDWLEKMQYGIGDIKLILEDRDRMVAAWRQMGLPCFQVRPGGY
jgi:hypothetical protein